MSTAIVDENVCIVANNSTLLNAKQEPIAPQADEHCRLAAIVKLKTLIETTKIAIDDEGAILKKYRKYLSGSGQPGVGDAFFKYIADNEYNLEKIVRVSLEKVGENYKNFPTKSDLQNFDRNDRIYVALALTLGSEHSVIINAVDSDYKIYSTALKQRGLQIEELCPQCLK